MSFSKLDSKITSSSLWDQPDHVIRVWIAFLAEKDENGLVLASYKAMRRLCNVTEDSDGLKFDEAIKILEAPDSESRSPEFDGRRIERVDGGWVVLNHEKYRLREDIIREKTRERVRKFREKNKAVPLGNVTPTLPSVSVSVSESVKEKEKSVRKEKEVLPEIPEHLKEVWPAFLEMRSSKKAVNSARAIRMILNELNKLSNDPVIQIKIVEKSTRSSWTDVYPLKESDLKHVSVQSAREREEDALLEKRRREAAAL